MTRLMTVVVGVGAVVVAGALVGWRVYEHGYTLPQTTCGSAVTHGLGAQTQLLSADLHRRSPPDQVNTTRCRVAAVTAQGVTLSCDGQHLLVPVTVSRAKAVS